MTKEVDRGEQCSPTFTVSVKTNPTYCYKYRVNMEVVETGWVDFELEAQLARLPCQILIFPSRIDGTPTSPEYKSTQGKSTYDHQYHPVEWLYFAQQGVVRYGIKMNASVEKELRIRNPDFQPLTLKVLDEPQSLLPRDDSVVRLVDEVCQHENRNVRRDLGDLPCHILESPRLRYVEEEDDAVRSLGCICFRSRPLLSKNLSESTVFLRYSKRYESYQTKIYKFPCSLYNLAPSKRLQ